MIALQHWFKRNIDVSIMLVVVLIISIIFPLFFAYIDRDLRWNRLLNEVWLTALRLLVMVTITAGIVWLGKKVAPAYPNHWLRHVCQLLVLQPMLLCWMLASLQCIEFPLLCPNCVLDAESWEFRRFLGLYFIIGLFNYAMVSGIDFYRQAQVKAAEAERLQQAYAQVRLQALRHQINPHFLFNSLSVLSSLVQQDAALSDQFIHKLSKAYRYIIDQKEMSAITLQAELDFIAAYFFLLQIRFGNKIKLTVDTEEKLLQYLLPPLTLQLLVENAVKHNRMSIAQPLNIHIATIGETLIVSNNIIPRTVAEASTGIGLENIRQRLAFICPKPIIVTQNNERFRVSVPLVSAKNIPV